MDFIKYPKTHRNIKQCEIDINKVNKLEWIATEKMHGANCSIYSNGSQIKLAKRSGFLEENENFYGFRQIKSKLENPVNNIFNELKQQHSELSYMIIFGELIGGWFPESPDNWEGAWTEGRINSEGTIMVPQKNRAVQEGIYYGNHCGIIVFDIWMIMKDKKQVYINYDEIMYLCDKNRLDVIKPLAKGTFNKVSNFDINFNSTIPKMWGYTMTELANNLAEGIVVRPVDYNDIGFCKVKIKHDIFATICDKSEFKKEDTEQAVTIILNGMINYERFYNVVTETGIEVCQENRDDIIREIIDDIIVDYHQRYDLPWENYDETMKNIQHQCSIIVDRELYDS